METAHSTLDEFVAKKLHCRYVDVPDGYTGNAAKIVGEPPHTIVTAPHDDAFMGTVEALHANTRNEEENK
jgi:hypothetical protein